MDRRELITDLDADAVARRLDEVRSELPDGVEILIATKYVAPGAMAALAEAGVTLVGENRAQDLAAKQEISGERFSWDFIGRLQSRKVKQIAPRVRLIHSVASDSVLEQLARNAPDGLEVLVQVNLSGEESKSGVPPEELEAFIGRCEANVSGLMTMPPFTTDPEQSRPYFARLAGHARELGLSRLSMGTSQDWRVAVEEGATIIRLGSHVLT